MDDRHLTLIVVPHGDLETRTFAISYRVLRILFIALAAGLLGFCVFLAFLFPMMAQAARVPSLERELKELEEDRARVAELAQSLAEVEAQYEKVRKMLGADAPVNGAGPTLPPLRRDSVPKKKPADGPVQETSDLTVWPLKTRGFITRTMNAGTTRHPGLDIAAPLGSEIRVAGSGVVLSAGEDEVYGRFVVVDHGGDVHTVYGHASRLYVERGERVKAGEVIALTGTTGRSTAPHLHFEVRQGGMPVDPLSLVQER